MFLWFLEVVRLAPNVASGGTATQSSDTGNRVASLVIDGNFDYGLCARTKDDAPVWWQVDLLEIYLVPKVAINSGSGLYSTSSLDLEFF